MGKSQTLEHRCVQISASVIIPAHNEGGVIGRCLSRLRDGTANGALDIIVVCNGCTDDTAVVAGDFPGVRVIQLETASKSMALNVGDKAARCWPRVFLDADVEVTPVAIETLAAALGSGSSLVASPRPRIDCSRSRLSVRMFYAVWKRLPYFSRGPIGAGAYALSERGRARFGAFPELIADDGFIERIFAESERASVRDAEMVIHAPVDIRSLIRIEARRRWGGKELRDSKLAVFPPQSRGQLTSLLLLGMRPWMWPAMAVYTSVRLAAEWKASTSHSRRNWARDESTRQPFQA